MFRVRHIGVRFCRLWQVLTEPWSFWLGLIVSITILYSSFAILTYFGFEKSADIIRVSGTMLQLLGMSTIIWDLNQKKKLFREKGIPGDIGKWVKRIAKVVVGSPHRIVGSANQTLPSLMKTTPKTGRPLQGSTLEEQVQDLHNKHEEMRNEIYILENKLNDKIDRSVAKESEKRDMGINQIHQYLSDATIGGFHIEIIGVIFLSLGVVCGTIPERIFALLPYAEWIVGL